MTAPAKVALRGVTRTFQLDARPYTAVQDVDLEVPAGSFTSIVGPSGCGKTSLLRMVAGFDPPTAGEVWIGDHRVRGVNPAVGFIFQQDALLPWRTVRQNVALGLRLRGVRGAELNERVTVWLSKVGLRGFDDHYPAQLSGGMRKRAAIAQVLACEPELLLMDEPFTHLDAQTRHLLQADLLRLCEGGSRTVLFVTHDLDEAIAMSDAIVLMTAGPASRVQAIHRVPIPRPRDLLGIRANAEFGRLSSLLWQHLYEEVTRAYGR